jgi:tripartite-type tricarboxylate transporter receptor subunit TctC
LIAISKAKPGGVTYGSQGIGASGHLSGELFQYMTGVKWVHVPYKGGAPALIDLLAGNITISFANIPTAIEHVRSKRLRALAVTGEKRSAAAPDVPTVAESGVPGYQVSNWFGLSAPAKTPPEIVHPYSTRRSCARSTPPDWRGHAQVAYRALHVNPGSYTALIQKRVHQVDEGDQGSAGIKGE